MNLWSKNAFKPIVSAEVNAFDNPLRGSGATSVGAHVATLTPSLTTLYRIAKGLLLAYLLPYYANLINRISDPMAIISPPIS
jgi:hypothetical protein